MHSQWIQRLADAVTVMASASRAVSSFVQYERSGYTKITYIALDMGLTESQVMSGIEDFAIHHPVSLMEATDLAMFNMSSVRDWVRERAAAQQRLDLAEA